MDVEWLGLAAGFLTTVAFLPQLVKAWNTKSTKDISLPTFIIFCLGILLWLVYGLIIGNLPVIAANFASIIIAAGILVLKIKHG